MGRHARLAEREALFNAFEEPADHAGSAGIPGSAAGSAAAEPTNSTDSTDSIDATEPFASVPPAAPEPAALSPVRRWISRVPLLPVVAGVGALGVVLAAYGTQQISLNFSDDGARHGRQVDGGGTPLDQTPLDQTGAPPLRQDAAAPGDPAGRGAAQASPVTVAFRATSKWADGFQGSATIVNVSGRPINGWTLAFRVPNAQVLSIWEVQVVRLGSVVIVRNSAQSPSIAPGDSVQIGFTARGAVGTPTACTFNQVRCHVT